MNPYTINPSVFAAKKPVKPKEKEAGINAPGMFEEMSYSEQDILQSYIPFGNNPDPVVKNRGLKIYRLMLEDEQIKACYDMRVQARLSSTWSVKPGVEGDSSSEEMAEFITAVLKRIRGNFENSLAQIYSAIVYGYSITEKVYDYIQDGEYQGKIGLAALKTREPFDYDFKTDAHGNLLGIIYSGMKARDEKAVSSNNGASATGSNSNADMGTLENPFPPEKFVIYSYNQMFGNHYGRSDLLSAFKWWIMKKHGSKFWAVWLERYASPFLRAIYDRDAGLKAEALTRMDDFIRNLSTRQGIRASNAWTIEPVMFSGSDGGKSYENAVEAFNRYISHAMLCPNLLGIVGNQGGGSTGGTYALGKKHFEAFIWILEKQGRDTSEEIVGEQIIKPLIEMNFGVVEESLLPKFNFLSLEEDSIEVRSRIITMLSGAGLVDANENWIRDFLTLPKFDPVDKKKSNELLPGRIEKQFPEEKGNWRNGNEKKNGKPNGKDSKPRRMDASKTQTRIVKFKEREPNFFEEKVKVKKFQKELESVEDLVAEESKSVLEEIRDDMIGQIQKKKIVSDGDAKNVDRLAMNVEPLNKILYKWMTKVWLDSSLRAFEELGRAGVTVEVTRKFQTFADTAMEPWEPLPPKEAVDFFRRKVLAKVVYDDGTKAIVDLTSGLDLSFIQKRAFYVSGIVRDDLLNDSKQILLNGIKRQDEAGAIKDIRDLFNRYVDQGIEIDEELLTPNRLNTIVRTNISEAVNEGRAALIMNEDVGDFVKYFEYTAIIDNRTTEYCQCMDGKVFHIEDLAKLNPPAHYNCRSFTVPITRFELEDLERQGRGVEIAEECFGRMEGFDDLKREPIEIPQANPDEPTVPTLVVTPSPDIEVVRDIPATPRSATDIAATDRLRRELTQIIVKCPYSTCHSNEIEFMGRRMNIGEFACKSCDLPFRVSNRGDIYLYDAGTEKWERSSMGLSPAFFSKQFIEKMKAKKV